MFFVPFASAASTSEGGLLGLVGALVEDLVGVLLDENSLNFAGHFARY